MNGQEDDYDDVFRYISSPSFMGIAEDDEINDTMGTTFGAGDQDGGNTIRNIVPIPQQNQEPENIYQECPHPMGTQARVDDIQNAPVERDSFINDLLVSLSSPLGNALPAYDSFVDDDVLDIPAPPSSPTLMLNPGSDLSTELGPMINDRSTSMVNPHATQPGNDAPQDKVDSGGETSPVNINSLLELADIAMNELIMLGEVNSPSWIIDSSSKRVTLDYQEYKSFFKNGFEKPPGYVIEASRETGTVHMECLPLVKTFTTDNWINVFAPIVPVTSIHNLIPKDSGGLRSGSLRLITAEFQVISPLVPKRQVKFLRYCKMLRVGFWVVVDFTPRQENLNFSSDDGSYRLPSGVIIEDCGNGYSEVKWIEQIEYDESLIPQLPELLISSRIGLGAKRWFTTLQRHCENISTLASINLDEIYPGLSSKVATEIVKLAQRMTINYYLCITASPASIWKSNDSESARQDIRVMIRKNNVGEHTRIVLSAATSLWLPVSKKTAFDFLINPSFRNQWDILAIDEPGNSVLQETWNDASGALLVYAPVDMEKILASENSNSVQILPSGFSILPDGGGETDPNRSRVGCLLTLGYQMLHSVKPTEDVDQDFVKKVERLMDRTMGKIKSALSR
uniref:START domain-containing protein n=1 Tax=Brassica campestris TaxID=3711 RepID=M4DBN8_BRACM